MEPHDGPTQHRDCDVCSMFADSETCIAWSEGSVGCSDRAKHVDLFMHFVHEARAAGHLQRLKRPLSILRYIRLV